MKKLILISALAGMIGLSSCKQDWRCQCIDKSGNVSNTAINGGTFIHAEHQCHSISKDCSLITEER
jgi:hypothetical protein